jgi:hypothetical protein
MEPTTLGSRIAPGPRSARFRHRMHRGEPGPSGGGRGESPHGSWDGKGRKHEGFEILVPWSYVVAILEIGEEGGGARRIGFL